MRSARRAEAEREAARLHRKIITEGWASVLDETKRQRAISQLEQKEKKTLAYWATRLLQRKYVPFSSRSPAAEYSVRIEHDGQAQYFPLGTSLAAHAASRALRIYTLILRKGWAAACQKNAREVTLAIHWAMEPVAWTYTTFHTLGHSRQGAPSSPSNQPRIKVVIVEPEPSLRKALQHWINRHSGLCCIATMATGEAASRYAEDKPGLLWLVNSAVDGAPGRDCLARIHQITPDSCGLIYGVYEDSNQVFLAPPGGASGYVLKRTAADSFLEPLTFGGVPSRIIPDQIVSRVQQYFQRTLAFSAISPIPVMPLTAREHEILELVGKGYVDKEIGDSLGISPWTVHGHMKNIFGKLKVHSRTEAVVRAFHK